MSGATDLRGYAGQWIAQRFFLDEGRAEVVASAPTRYELKQHLEVLGIGRSQVGIWRIPDANTPPMI
ncbi:MAG: hypothetical protein ACREN8_02365 [Candidatus Dormibacteraceae bacterium]